MENRWRPSCGSPTERRSPRRRCASSWARASPGTRSHGTLSWWTSFRSRRRGRYGSSSCVSSSSPRNARRQKMADERWFETHELDEMARPTMDRAIEAIERGDLTGAVDLCQAMKHEWRFLHDLMAESMLGLVTYNQ